jgi:hypothetical protein
MMRKKLLSLSVTSALVLAGVVPSAFAQDAEDCDGILVQSRFALANCMLESAAAIAAAVVTQEGCLEGEWDIEAVVPEWVLETIPIQGFLTLQGGEDALALTGQSSAQLQNNVNCQVATTDAGNSFGGLEVNYSSGSGNFYPDAIIDRDLYLLCISDAQSAGNITVQDSGDEYEESNNLEFEEEDGVIEADGTLLISARRGQGGGGGRPAGTALSEWDLDEEVIIPAVNQTAIEGFEFEAESADVPGLPDDSVCEIEIEADIENLDFPITEDSGGLTITGKLEIYVEPEDDEE